MKRQPDGSFRNARRPLALSAAVARARWVEGETLHLKRLGMSYQKTAQHLIEVARGAQPPLVPLPADISFPDDYSISAQAVHRAFKRGLARSPSAEAAELRKVDNERLDDLYLALQAGIRQGDPRSIEVAVRVLTLQAEINGYRASTAAETRVNVLVQNQSAKDQETLADLDRLSLDELRQLRRLEAKAHGVEESIETEAVLLSAPEDDAASADTRETHHADSSRTD